MARRTIPLLTAIALSLAGCPAGRELAIDVRTDLVPGLEFDAVRVDLDGRAEPPLSARDDDDFASARRVHEYPNLASGLHLIDVALLRSGATVVSRRVAVRFEGSQIVLVLLTRDCRGVSCPGTGDGPNDTECLGGRCVDPTCFGDDPSCRERDCTTDAECTSETACVAPRCVTGVCIELPRAGGCGASEVCVPGAGCVPRPSATDAGVPSDAVPPTDGGGGCSAASCVAGPCETAMCVGGGCERSSTCADGEACCSGVCAPDCGTALCAGRAAGFVCRAAAGPCDVEETCNGTDVSCPPDTLASSSTVCREATGTCDLPESCNGATAVCPPDAFAPVGMACSAGSCDGLGACTSGCTPGAPCSTGNPCERGEVDCTTGSLRCLAAGAAPASTVCRAAAGPCDVAETCGGSTTCPGDAFRSSSTTCRTSVGVCDRAETCTGSSADCPSDGFLSSSTTCRTSAGVCDIAETCTGSSASCPGDSFRSGTTCRTATGVCDVAETCSGSSSDCPPNGFAGAGLPCAGMNTFCDGAGLCCSLTCEGISSCPPTCGACGGDFNCTCSCCGGSVGQTCS